jgi:hypothetical protein
LAVIIVMVISRGARGAEEASRADDDGGLAKSRRQTSCRRA